MTGVQTCALPISLVDRPDRAFETLGSLGFNVAFTDVIAVKMRDEPGGLYEIARILGDAQINIEYSYAYSGKEGAVLILRVDDLQSAIQALLERGAGIMESSAFQ